MAYDNWLVYITGGAAFGGVQDSLHQNFDWGLYTKGPSQHEVLGRSHNEAFVGYVLGAGLEYGISPAWSVKFEYQYMDLGFTRLTLDGHNQSRFRCQPRFRIRFRALLQHGARRHKLSHRSPIRAAQIIART